MSGPLSFRGLGFDRVAHGLLPVAVLYQVETLVLGALPAGDGLEAQLLGVVVRAVDPVARATAHVVPRGGPGQVGLLAGAELLQVVRGGHAAGVEEVLVLADPGGTKTSSTP